MSSYHTSFTYQGISSTEKGVVIVAFDSDDGNVNSFLGMDEIYSETIYGIRHDYGAVYNTTASFTITMITYDGSDFTLERFRDVTRWLSGARKSTWLDLYENDSISYSFLCKCTEIEQYKMDGRTIGVTATFTSVSPWAYSPMQTIVKEIDNTASVEAGTPIEINNISDEGYAYIYPNVVFNCSKSGELSIYNHTTEETTTISNILTNEIITMKNNQIIYSDRTSRVFGNDFNFNWLKFAPGKNILSVSGQGTLTITYRYPMKVGDCTINLDVNRDGDMCMNMGQDLATDIEVMDVFSDVFNTVFGGIA